MHGNTEHAAYMNRKPTHQEDMSTAAEGREDLLVLHLKVRKDYLASPTEHHYMWTLAEKIEELWFDVPVTFSQVLCPVQV